MTAPTEAQRLQQQIDEIYKRLMLVERKTQALPLMPQRRNCPHCHKLIDDNDATHCVHCRKLL